MNIRIRFADPDDIKDILKIYSQYIDTNITFECALPAESEYLDMMQQVTELYPFIVIELDGVLCGYAYAHTLRQREAYSHVCETSVYTDRNAESLSLGKKLYGALLEILTLQNFRAAYACVTVPNPKSDRLHSLFGFSHVGTFNGCGYKCGKYISVNWYEKILTDFDPPKELIPVKNLSKEQTAKIFANHALSIYNRHNT